MKKWLKFLSYAALGTSFVLLTIVSPPIAIAGFTYTGNLLIGAGGAVILKEAYDDIREAASDANQDTNQRGRIERNIHQLDDKVSGFAANPQRFQPPPRRAPQQNPPADENQPQPAGPNLAF